jgi:Domain of unknown function (DU1801)
MRAPGRKPIAKPTTKTVATEASVIAFIAAITDPVQRADAQKIAKMMARVSGVRAKMWGPSIIGFGQYHYKYESGREGDAPRIGFSPRKGQTVIYMINGNGEAPALMARLGTYTTGKSCLYIKQLSNVDEAVLEALCRQSLAAMALRYPVS